MSDAKDCHLQRLAPLVTLAIFGALTVAAAVRLGWASEGAIRLPIVAALAAAAVLDVKSRRIPDWLTLPALAWALGASLLPSNWRPWDALSGAIVAAGLLLGLALLSRGGVGGGDVKLSAAIGASLGVQGGLFVLAAAQLSAALIALPLFLTRQSGRRSALPLGPFLALPAILALLIP